MDRDSASIQACTKRCATISKKKYKRGFREAVALQNLFECKRGMAQFVFSGSALTSTSCIGRACGFCGRFVFLFGEFCDGVHAFVCGIVCGSLIFVTPVGGTIDAICRAPLENVDHDVYISSCCGECVSDGQHLLAVRIVCATNARVGWRQAIVSYGCISQTHSCAPLWCACASVLFYVFVFASMC